MGNERNRCQFLTEVETEQQQWEIIYLIWNHWIK